MTDFRRVTDDFTTAPQISVADVVEAKAQGFTAIICNRPDGEDPGQPAAAEIAAAAEAAGLTYAHIPVRGAPGPAEVEAMRQAVDAAEGPVLAYCRSGTRSITAWAIGQAMSGARTRGELVSLGRAAGYDLSGALGG
ncbi:TIGR01244 family sulfur transferase [Phenylobacterium sp.]|uniref:TIGR01244 family sulfur transferase n=1 Tax=Phenylobacterium sp. TaxID=1871053 RepID=UPI001205972E|nr:TIGR01244 family sulfur transferase [Phenylobacterium sp.]THD54619.1 MAG: TIGR01244 family phosphatase [Phenylobacterium sp.]